MSQVKDQLLDIISDGDTSVVTPTREIYFSDVRDFKHILERLESRNIILDCKNVTSLESSIMGVLMTCVRRGKKVKLKVSENSYIREVVSVYGLRNIIEMESL